MTADGYYQVSEPVFIGSFPARQELEVLPVDTTVKGWTIEKVVAVNGNKYLRLLKKYLKRKGKSSEDELSSEEIQKLYDKAAYK